MTEKELHKQICTYLKVAYPKAIFNTDMSGIKLTLGQSVQAKKLRSSNGFPDIMIYEKKGNISALFLEVKKETPYKKDGNLKNNDHLREQSEMHLKLKERGYSALFVWSLDQAITIINCYLRKK